MANNSSVNRKTRSKSKVEDENLDANSQEELLASSITDDIIQAFRNEDVLEALAKAMSPFIKLAVQEAINNNMKELNHHVENLTSDNKRLNKITQDLTTENEALKRRVSAVEETLKSVQISERANNIILSGLKEETFAQRTAESAEPDSPQAESHASVERSVLALITDQLHIDAKPEHISIAYRLKKGKKDSIRPIFVKFSCRKMRDSVYAARKKLDGQNIFISEHLTRENSDLLFKARQMKREGQIFSAWSRGGLVYVKATNDVNCKPKLITSPLDLPHAIYT